MSENPFDLGISQSRARGFPDFRDFPIDIALIVSKVDQDKLFFVVVYIILYLIYIIRSLYFVVMPKKPKTEYLKISTCQ